MLLVDGQFRVINARIRDMKIIISKNKNKSLVCHKKINRCKIHNDIMFNLV